MDTQTYKDKLFTLYQRFHTHREGRGLGLYLVKTQIEALGGYVEIKSTVGEGTTFHLYFDASRSAKLPTSSKPQSQTQ